MKQLAALLSLLSLLFLSVAAHAEVPTEASIVRLLDDMHIEKVVEAMKPAVENMMKQSELQATNGIPPSAADQKAIDKFHAKVIDIMAATLTMDKLRPLYVRIYSQNFTQEEVDGLIAFMESPVGQAYVTKLPKAMQAVMAEMPALMAPMTQQIREAGKDLSTELAALHSQGTK